jgi:hypothetical protein
MRQRQHQYQHQHRSAFDRDSRPSSAYLGAVLLPSFCLLTFLIMVHLAALTAISGVGLSSAPTVLILDLVQSGVPPTAEREIRRTVARRCQFNGLPASGAVAVGATAWRPHPSYTATTSWQARSA